MSLWLNSHRASLESDSKPQRAVGDHLHQNSVVMGIGIESYLLRFVDTLMDQYFFRGV